MPKKIKRIPFTPEQQTAALARLATARKTGDRVAIQGRLQVALNQVHEEIHQHRVHEVYRVVILQEMVLQGTGSAFEFGPALIPDSGLEDTAPLWSGVPILVNHPDFQLGIEQHVIDSEGLGFVFWPWYNSHSKELLAELWIDKEVAEANSRWVDLKAQAENGVLELSTGYFILQNEEKAGSFEGVEYKSIHRGIIPLHLALLPDDTGACSVADGCGINQVAAPEAKKSVAEVLTGVLEAYGLKNILPGSGGAAAHNSQNQKKEASSMNEALAKLVAALKQALSLSDEQATKLAGNCDCPDLMTQVATNLNSLYESASKVATLQTSVTTLQGKLEVFEAKEAKTEGEARKGYLKALNLNDEDGATKATPTAFLKTLAITKGHVPEGATDAEKAAATANLSSKPEKQVVTFSPADTSPKKEGK